MRPSLDPSKSLNFFDAIERFMATGRSDLAKQTFGSLVSRSTDPNIAEKKRREATAQVAQALHRFPQLQ
jgi:hypothetical protein